MVDVGCCKCLVWCTTFSSRYDCNVWFGTRNALQDANQIKEKFKKKTAMQPKKSEKMKTIFEMGQKCRKKVKNNLNKAVCFCCWFAENPFNQMEKKKL